MNKGIIVIGSAASGKTTLLKQLIFDEFIMVNSDILVENKESGYYNNPLKAASFLHKVWLPSIIESNKDFILDTTGANLKTIENLIKSNNNYEFKLIINYCNPVIAFYRNFNRERKLPKQILLDNWIKVYSNTKEYIKMFGENNIYTYETDYTEKEMTVVNDYQMLRISAKSELTNIEAKSSFSKNNTQYSTEQIELKNKLFIKTLEEIDKNVEEFEFPIYLHHPPKHITITELQKWILEKK